MRFMDARPDGRAVVYAHIQADPLVVRAAELLAAATTVQRLLARAVMNGESLDPATWRTMFPTLFGPAAPSPGDPVRDRSEGILAVSLSVADRGDQTRSQFRGAIVEALAERLLVERTAPRPQGATDPVRRPPCRDPSLRRDRRARRGRRGLGLQVGCPWHQVRCAPPARTTRGGGPPMRAPGSWSAWSSSTRGARARSGSSGSAVRSPSRASSSSRSMGWIGLPDGSRRERCPVRTPRSSGASPFPTGSGSTSAARTGWLRTSALLRYAQDIAWVHSERMGFDRDWYATRDLAWVVRAVELAILEPLRLGADHRPDHRRHRGFARYGPDGGRKGGSAMGRLVLWGHTDWVMTDTRRGLPGRVPQAFPAAFEVPPGSFEPGKVPLPPAPADAVHHRSAVRPQDLDPMGHVNNAAYVDYLEEALAAAGPGAAPPSPAPLAGSGSSTWPRRHPARGSWVSPGRTRSRARPDGPGGSPITTGGSWPGRRALAGE